ncbi:MAG: hypothetical protein V4714_15445 [Bacteroidota bacterium]
MRKQGLFILLIALFIQVKVFAQASDTIKVNLIFPDQLDWNVVKEGTKLEFHLKALGGSNGQYTFSIPSGKIAGVKLDSVGNFSWTPDFDFVDRLQESKVVQMLFEGKNILGESATQPIDFKVMQVNRPPEVTELKTLYLQNNVLNTYPVEAEAVKDPDNDPIVFIAITDQMPEGAKLSSKGEFTWKPSIGQFNHLKSKPITLEFLVEDQPNKAQTKGKFRIEATQMDLPPDIAIVPKIDKWRKREGEAIQLEFYLSDPNGDDNIRSFEFVSSDVRVPKKSLIKNTPTQYEFIWQPDYNFVSESRDSLTIELDFFVIDKTNKREERRIAITILDTENKQEKDRNLYNKYRVSLVSAWDLIEQLKQKEKDLKKELKEAKTGKKHRSIVNAALGAVTGITPALSSMPSTSQRIISSVGGTTVLTMGTLEATNVIGKSQGELIEKMNSAMEKKNELQTKGDIYARKYALASSRLNPAFLTDTQDFISLLNLRGTLALELDAGWKNKKNATDGQISQTFKDFIPFTE